MINTLQNIKCLIIVFLLTPFTGFSQSTIHVKSNSREVSISLNGQTYHIDTNYQEIPIVKNGFDTLNLGRGGNILCDFENDSSYIVALACCAEFDIYPSSKYEHDSISIWSSEVENYDEVHFKIKDVLQDRPEIKFKVINGNNEIPIYAWYADHACFPSFKRVDKQDWLYGSPLKCFYWSNISTFQFFSTDDDYSETTNEDGIIEDIYPEQSYVLASIRARLFKPITYLITYDTITRKITIEPIE